MTDPVNPEDGFSRFEVWKKYEDVAMHFNDLIIKLRSQSLGGVAAIATVAAVVARSDASAEIRWSLLTGAFFLLGVFWIAVWVLDLCYYNRLLAGAVDALIALESESRSSSRVSELDLSRRIENQVRGGGVKNNGPRQAFYIIVFAALLVGFTVSLCKWKSAG